MLPNRPAPNRLESNNPSLHQTQGDSPGTWAALRVGVTSCILVRMDEPVVDAAEAVAELTEAFMVYEAALVAGDVATMGESFWDDQRLVRYGIANQQNGAVALAAWRARQPGVGADRTLSETQVTTFGTAFGIVTTVFRYPGRPMKGRQSQCWVRGADRWRVVSAHVSEIPDGDSLI